jgi:dTDP-glucose pyrophosphorylase
MENQSHILKSDTSARQALRVLDSLPDNASRTLFIVDESDCMVGSLTDGDIRRGLLKDLEISNPVSVFMNTNYRFIERGQQDDLEYLRQQRKADIKLIPILDQHHRIIKIINLSKTKTLLPIAALIMAGGKGERLKPFTEKLPKPMLQIGDKPILEHNIDRLISFGIVNFYISVRYLKEQIIEYFGNGESKGVSITYIEEEVPLGTLGALSKIERIPYDDILVMNADILTNIDFEDFFQCYKKEEADMVLASIPYKMNVPYAVLEVDNSSVVSFVEKPTYTYYSNGGIYLMKFSLKEMIRENAVFNATDMMNGVIGNKQRKLVHYPLLNYWLDIGRHADFLKAQEDIKHIYL